MNKQVLFAAGVSALLAGAPFVSAQAPAQTPSPSTDPASTQAAPSSSAPQTVTGCLTPGADGKSFILTEISPSSSSTASPSTAASATPKTWTLVSSGDVDLTKYANHKVEITGSTEDKGRSSAYPPPSSSPSTAAATSGPKLQVKSVKDVSNSCS